MVEISQDTMMDFQDTFDELPPICGREREVAQATADAGPVVGSADSIDIACLNSGFAVALHMHQPLIPAGGNNLQTASIISNLQHMMDNPHSGDNHNAPVFLSCYRRMGEFIPQLLAEGKRPRIMLDYSGCLFHGLVQMRAGDVIESLRRLACEAPYRDCVEWLGGAWGHPVAPSTPVQDFRLHVRAWQHQFGALFGWAALSRVKGFSPAEMALPNHPDVAYEFVRTLKDCGYRWVLVQEHSIEQVEDGGPVRRPHIPHRLVVRNSRGEETSIVALIKTQGSDTKLVGQMQPFYEAKTLRRVPLAGREIPPLVTQIGDGENGGVMMNEFPGKFFAVAGETTGCATAALNGTEYLEHLAGMGLVEQDFPCVQPVHQARLWARLGDRTGPEAVADTIAQLQREDNRFHMEGGSWTNNLSWVRGYDNVLKPMEQVSVHFARKVLDAGVDPSERRYRNALFHLLVTQTSCYRYWGQGVWTDYAVELCRRADAILTHDF